MRAPYQTLTILYKKQDNKTLYGIFYRTTHPAWQFVSGGGEDNETPIETAIREINEETGLQIINPEFFTIYSGEDEHLIYPNGDEVFYVNVVYIVREYTGDLTKDEESEELKFFKMNEIPSNTTKTLKNILNDLKTYN